MKYNFNKPLRSIKGEEQSTRLSDALADLLSTENSNNAVKLYGWALALVNTGELVLDKADKKILEELISTSNRMIVLLKAQLLECFETPVKDTVPAPEQIEV